ncbi:MAG: DUF2065 family protein [Rhodobacteraceae bacterium]|nr:DUF2065 family protein [Paracoccaceae bacterium]
MITLVLVLGGVCVVEGLILALIPGRIEEALALFARLPVETRRGFGLGALAVGVALIWLARMLGG